MRVMIVLLLFFICGEKAFAQPPKLKWLSFQVDNKMDTASLPRLSAEEKALDVKNKKRQEEIERNVRKIGNYTRKSIDTTAFLNYQADTSSELLTKLHGAMDSVEEDKGKEYKIPSLPGVNEGVTDSLKEKMEEDMAQIQERLKENAAKIIITNQNSSFDTLTGIINYNTICQPMLINDTLTIISGVGFFAGYGIVIQIAKNSFAASFGANADNDDVFKRVLSDTSFENHIEVSTTNAKLTLLKHPEFKKGENVCGYLEADFVPFYEKTNRTKDLTVQTYHGKVFFKCIAGDNIKCEDCSPFISR